MSEQDYLKDISDIKDLMNRSSRFISLSGLSGILAGVYAIVGAAIAYKFILPGGKLVDLADQNRSILLVLLAAVAALSILTAILLTGKKARSDNIPVWDATTRRLVINFLVPLITGGIYILIDLEGRNYGLTAALMLIFYGLALVNASKYTIGNIKYLGYGEILAGLICAVLPAYGFWFWVIGFGLMHMLYGILMNNRENKKA